MTREEAKEILQAVKFLLPIEEYSERVEEALDMAIEALEKATPIPNGNLINFGDIGSPTIKPLVKRGEWIGIEDYESLDVIGYYCSVCDLPMETEVKTNYCPNCGSDMRGAEDVD